MVPSPHCSLYVKQTLQPREFELWQRHNLVRGNERIRCAELVRNKHGYNLMDIALRGKPIECICGGLMHEDGGSKEAPPQRERIVSVTSSLEEAFFVSTTKE